MSGTSTRLTLALLAVALVINGAPAALAQGFEIPADERALMRTYAQWWLSYSEKENQERIYRVADEAFERGNFWLAENRYRVLARYGDKFAQFRLGLIADEEGRPEDAWAWFELATEGNTEPSFAPYPDQIWEQLDTAGRERARALRAERFPMYGDFAVAKRMKRIFSRQKRSITGSRTGFVGFVQRGDGVDPALFYETISNGLTFSTAFTERYGTVSLGELEVIEGDSDMDSADR